MSDKRLSWDLLKIEMRAATIGFAKAKAKSNHDREEETTRQLDELHNVFCNNFHHPEIFRA